MQRLETKFFNSEYYVERERNTKQIFHLFEKANDKSTLKVNFRDLLNPIHSHTRTTHSIHRYPGKLLLHIPRFFLNNDVFSSYRDLVLDPFCGTGTVLLESLIHNRNSLGVELNPVSSLISKVKTTPLNVEKTQFAIKKLFSNISKNNDYVIPDFPNIDYWFTKKSKNDLSKILNCITSTNFDSDIEDFFLVCFSSIVRRASKADPYISQPVITKKMRLDKKRTNVNKLFQNEILINFKRMQNFMEMKFPRTKAEIIQDDVKNIKIRKKIDLVITSPPYITAQEYLRSTKLEYYWLGYGDSSTLCDLKRQTLGMEGFVGNQFDIPVTGIKKLDSVIDKIAKDSKNKGFIIAKYYNDFDKILYKLYPKIREQGFVILVIGNNTIQGRKINSNKFIADIAQENGFVLRITLVDDIKKHNESPVRNNTSSTMKEEYVLILQKV